MLEMTRYLPEGGFAGGGMSEVPGRIAISDGRIGYSRCPRYSVAFRISETGQLVKTGGPAFAAIPRDCRELSPPPEAPMMPALADVVRLLHAKDRAPDGLYTNVGQGDLDWITIVDSAKAANVEAYIVEHDAPPAPLDDINVSYQNLTNALQ